MAAIIILVIIPLFIILLVTRSIHESFEIFQKYFFGPLLLGSTFGFVAYLAGYDSFTTTNGIILGVVIGYIVVFKKNK